MTYPTPASSFPQSHSEIEMEIRRSSPARTIDASSASSSTAADPTTSGSCDYRYDVFINHRGPDTKKTFASYLYRRLRSHGFRVFLDQQELQEGLHFPSQIAGVIRTASVHVAIFSLSYTESPWCLEELHLMRKSGAPVIPVFYHVEPSSLRHGEALDYLERKTKRTDETQPRYDPDTIQKWRNALSSFADVSGFDLDGGKFNGDEGQMLDKVVEHVVEILAKNTGLYVAKYPTGLDNKVKDFETVLKQQHTGKVHVVGIVGLGGVGKTTLALEFFNRKRSEYSNSHFLSDVRENAKSSLNLLPLQKDLLKGLTRSDQCIDNIHQGTQKLKEFLSSSQVLLILDDVDHEEQVDRFLPDRDVCCSNSLILITTRDRDVLRRSGVEDTSIYKLTGLATERSRELFCSYAFSHPYPLQGFEDLVDKFLMACHGLPLSLKVFGALLLGKNDDKSFWEDTLSQVHEVPDDIQKRLKISYDALHEKEQQIFLDIACFFIGEKRDVAVRMWDEEGSKGSLRFLNVQSKCLVEVDNNNCIHMHDHLRDMGREIAKDKLPRRLWHPKENIDDFLLQSSVITEVRGIRTFLNGETDSHDETLSCYQSERIAAFKLQLLQTEGYLLERILTRVHSPNLVWLSWRDCPYSDLPSWIPMNNLRVLKVKGEVLKTLWQDTSKVPFQLLELEISGGLSEISKSIGKLKHLERIFFNYGSFQKLPEEFCNMKSLKVLVLKGCTKLKALPDSFGNLTNLQDMGLSGCSSLERLPESLGNLTNLQSMDLDGLKSLNWLPESLGNLRNLQSMQLSGLESLKWLPESLDNLRNLQSMQLSGLESLNWLPESLGNLTNLQSMGLDGLKSLNWLPESLGNLRNLQSMQLSGLESLKWLPESLGDLRNLQNIQLSGLENLKWLPESLGNLTNLQSMDLDGLKSLNWLPESLGNLRNLQSMQLSGLESLKWLPESLSNLRNLQSMQLSGLESLKWLSESLGSLTNLQSMDLDGLKSLNWLPESLGNLRNLQSMQLSGLESLKWLPESLGNLRNLQSMQLSGLESLKWLPESLGNLRNLQSMQLSGLESLNWLPESLCNLTNLQSMDLDGLKSLEWLPESLGNLKNLQSMQLSGLESLKGLPESLGNLTNLQSMQLFGLESLKWLPTIKTLLSLEELQASHCVKLKSIPDLAQLTKLRLLNVKGCLALEELDGVEHCKSLLELNAIECPNLKWGDGAVNKLRQQNAKILI